MTIQTTPKNKQKKKKKKKKNKQQKKKTYSILHTWVNTHTRDVTNVSYLRFEATSDVFIHLP